VLINICTDTQLEADALDCYVRLAMRGDCDTLVSTYRDPWGQSKQEDLRRSDLMIYGLFRRHEDRIRAEGYFCCVACCRSGIRALLVGGLDLGRMFSIAYWHPGEPDSLAERISRVVSLDPVELRAEFARLPQRLSPWMDIPSRHGPRQ
jgi:hypothetical protein